MAEEDATSCFLDFRGFRLVSSIPPDSLLALYEWDKELSDLLDDPAAPERLAIEGLMTVPAFVRAPITFGNYHLRMYGFSDMGPTAVKYDHDLETDNLLRMMTHYEVVESPPSPEMRLRRLPAWKRAELGTMRYLFSLRTMDELKTLPVDFMKLVHIGDASSENREDFIDDSGELNAPVDMSMFDICLRQLSFARASVPILCADLSGYLKNYGPATDECNASCYGVSTKSLLKLKINTTGKCIERDDFFNVSEDDPDFCSRFENDHYIINMCDIVMDLFTQFKKWYLDEKGIVCGTKCDFCLARLFFAKHCLSIIKADREMRDYIPVGWLPWNLRGNRFQFSTGFTHRYAFLIAFCKLFATRMGEILYIGDYLPHLPFDFAKVEGVVRFTSERCKGIFTTKTTVIPDFSEEFPSSSSSGAASIL